MIELMVKGLRKKFVCKVSIYIMNTQIFKIIPYEFTSDEFPYALLQISYEHLIAAFYNILPDDLKRTSEKCDIDFVTTHINEAVLHLLPKDFDAKTSEITVDVCCLLECMENDIKIVMSLKDKDDDQGKDLVEYSNCTGCFTELKQVFDLISPNLEEKELRCFKDVFFYMRGAIHRILLFKYAHTKDRKLTEKVWEMFNF